MIVWTPIAVDEKPYLRGRGFIPPYSATVIGTSVVLRMYGGGITSLRFPPTFIPWMPSFQPLITGALPRFSTVKGARPTELSNLVPFVSHPV